MVINHWNKSWDPILQVVHHCTEGPKSETWKVKALDVTWQKEKLGCADRDEQMSSQDDRFPY